MIQTKGINHIALVCRDMAETVRFYTKVLHMPLVKTVQLPDGGQHFFFSIAGEGILSHFSGGMMHRRQRPGSPRSRSSHMTRRLPLAR